MYLEVGEVHVVHPSKPGGSCTRCEYKYHRSTGGSEVSEASEPTTIND